MESYFWAHRSNEGQRKAMGTDSPTLEITVDSEVHLDADATPPRLLAALRRQLRRHDLQRLLAHDSSQAELFSLLSSDESSHRMPQALLTQLTDTCHRHGIPYAVSDQRSMVSCPAFRCSTEHPPARRAALHRLLLHDSGVLVAPGIEDRWALAAELLARRQQRTLILSEADALEGWHEALSSRLDLAPQEIAIAGPENAPGSRIVIAHYRRGTELLERRPESFGMIVFDQLQAVDPISLLRPVRISKARYLLGLSAATTRADELHGPLFLVCGGVVGELARPTEERAQKLAVRRRPTGFAFAYSGRDDYQALLAALAEAPERNAQIAEDVIHEASLGHPCLVLSERREHLQTLLALIEQAQPAAAITAQVRPTERAALVDQFERCKLRVLLSTSQIAVDAIRTPKIRRVFITFPFSFGKKLERLGEALLAPSPGKVDAIVFDYDDVAIGPLHNACDKRAQTLARLTKKADQSYKDWAQLKLDI